MAASGRAAVRAEIVRDSATAGPDVRDIYRARERVRRVARRTPLQASSWLSEVAGCEVHLKLECWQRTNSFKIRGAYNAVATLDDATRARGLVTASAGNHGQAVALAARLFDTPATIFVPTNAPETKKTRIRSFGADLRELGDSYDDAAAAARDFSAETGAHYVHAFVDPAVVAGQGTVGLEELPDVREIIVPVGGGGLIAGVGLAARSVAPSTRVLGVQSTMTASMHRAFEAGGVVDTPLGETLCDGLAGEVEETSYRRARAVVDRMLLVDEAGVSPAIRALFQREGVVAEGAGAVGVATLLAGGLDLRGPAVVIVSGGNIDVRHLARIFSED